MGRRKKGAVLMRVREASLWAESTPSGLKPVMPGLRKVNVNPLERQSPLAQERSYRAANSMRVKKNSVLFCFLLKTYLKSKVI